MEFELRQENVHQTGNIANLGGTLRRLFFNYRASIVGLPNDEKYNLPEYTGYVDIDLNNTGVSFELSMYNRAAELVVENYPTIVS